jgi:hypothetical protein
MPRAIGIGIGVNFGGRVPFSPLDLSPALWLDAADTSTITESSGSVSQWNDKSGNAYHVSQATGANQPTYVTAGQNGLNVIAFDGNDALVRNTATDLGRNVVGATAYVVRRYFALPGGQQTLLVISSGTSSMATRIGLFAGVTTNKPSVGGRTLDADSFMGTAGANDVSTTQYQIQTGVFDYANTDLYLYVGTSLANTNNSFQAATTTSNTASLRSVVGNLEMTGRIAEILVYHAAHNASQRQQVWDYLTAKWGL